MNKNNKIITLILLGVCIIFLFLALYIGNGASTYRLNEFLLPLEVFKEKSLLKGFQLYDSVLPFIYHMILCIIMATTTLLLKSKKLFIALIIISSLTIFSANYPMVSRISKDNGGEFAWRLSIFFGSILLFLDGIITLIALFLLKKFPAKENKIYKNLYIVYLMMPLFVIIYYLKDLFF